MLGVPLIQYQRNFSNQQIVGGGRMLLAPTAPLQPIPSCQLMSTDVNNCRLMSTIVDWCQQLSTYVNNSQLMSTDVNWCQQWSTEVNNCRRMSTVVNLCQQLSISDVNSCQESFQHTFHLSCLLYRQVHLPRLLSNFTWSASVDGRRHPDPRH